MATAPELSTTDIAELAGFAARLATAAAAITCKYFRADIEVDDKHSRGVYDPVTVADKDAETEIRRLIKETYPTHGILGEEHGHEPGTSPFTWVLDPIDGTRSFISGVPLWGTLIGLNNGIRPIIGVMDQPYIGELFIGWPGHAELIFKGESQKLQTSTCTKLEDAILGCTDLGIFSPGKELETFQALQQDVRLWRFGGDCYFYALLALGKMDLVVESGLEPYDIQALIPIVEGAGGIITSWSGGDAQEGGQVVAAATPQLHAQALAKLQSAAT